MNSFDLAWARTPWGRAEKRKQEHDDLRLLIGSLLVDCYLRDSALNHMGIKTGPDLRTWSRCIKSGLIDC